MPRRQALREKSCLGKKTFRRFRDAAAAIREIETQYILSDSNRLNIYHCPFGSHLHIGHSWRTAQIADLMQDFPLEVSG